MKFYKRDPDRALAGMAELTLKQRGAYNSLLDLLYARDGEVPDDDQRVSRMLSCHWREWATVKLELIALGKVWTENGRLCAKRVQETLKEASEFSQEQSKRASQRWTKSENTNENNDPHMPRGNAPTPTPTPTLKQEESFSNANGMGTGMGTRANGNGKANGHTTIKDPVDRIARFQRSLIPKLGSDGWIIIDVAMRPDHPDHNRCLALCQKAAQALHKGWPHQWPTYPE